MAELENIRTIPVDKQYQETIPYEPDIDANDADTAEKEAEKETLEKLKSWWYQEFIRQAANRAEMAKDEDFYDGDQWDPDAVIELNNRGQKAVVFNKVKQACDALIGAERKSKIDFKVYARDPEEDEVAESKTALCKYVSDVNKFAYEKSNAYEEMVKGGMSYIELGIRSDPDEEPIYIRNESWRYCWYDSVSRSKNPDNWRYFFRAKTIDLDIAQAMFPDKKEELRIAAEDGLAFVDYDTILSDPFKETEDGKHEVPMTPSGLMSDFGKTPRKRVTIIEAWYKELVDVRIMRGNNIHLGTYEGMIIPNETDPDLKMLLDTGYASLYDAKQTVVKIALFVPNALLQNNISPYKHGRFPFVPLWGYRKGKDGTPYGYVRPVRDVQEDLNKRRSKSLAILCSNQVVAENNAVEDWDEAEREKLNPNGTIKIRAGSKFEFVSDKGLAQQHISLMEQDAAFIVENSRGAFNMGVGGEQSGKALIERGNDADIANMELADNNFYCHQLTGEILLALIEQYYDEPKVFRILGEDGSKKMYAINQPMPDGTIKNDMTRSHCDFIVDRMAYNETIRKQMSETMLKLLGQVQPEVGLKLLDIPFIISDSIPNKSEVIQRIWDVNGMDPKKKDAPPSPQEEMQMQQMQLALQKLQAEIAKIQSDAQLNSTRVQVEQADAQSKVARIQKDENISRINNAKAVAEIRNSERRENREDIESNRRLIDAATKNITARLKSSQDEQDRKLDTILKIMEQFQKQVGTNNEVKKGNSNE